MPTRLHGRATGGPIMTDPSTRSQFSHQEFVVRLCLENAWTVVSWRPGIHSAHKPLAVGARLVETMSRDSTRPELPRQFRQPRSVNPT